MGKAPPVAADFGTVEEVTAFEVPPIRIGHEERQAAVDALGEHFAAGRIDIDEHGERVAAAYAARTQDDVAVLFADLPQPQAPDAPTAFMPMPMPVPVPPQWAPMPVPLAPYGVEPATGIPYSDRSKVAAGVLQIVLPFGIGRFYSGHTGIAIAQLLLSIFGIGILWCWIDGIFILAGQPTDPYGRLMIS